MLKKDITFIYMDMAERSMYLPIAKEAEKRGYKVTLTDDKFAKCEIGFYCQHINFPQYSKFSVIMLHDIIQQYSNWPDLWYREPWNKYDIGILPSDQWQQNWDACSHWYYARPRKGMYKIGWPKADVIAELQKNTYRDKFFETHGLDINKKTILYAPAWENDQKQDDFVRSMLKLDVNIVVKQAPFNPVEYPAIVKNIQEMADLHRDIDRVVILPPETNIFEAIAVSDVLVSEESSTMCEAVMMGKPAVSVSDWLIPDTVPSRLPKCDYDFVFMTQKAELTGFISNMLSNYNYYKSIAEEYADKHFANIGSTSKMIMDIVDDNVNGVIPRYEVLPAKANVPVELKKELQRKLLLLRIEISSNYAERYSIVNYAWNLLKKMKKFLKG